MKNKGFSLTEIIIVVMMIGILSSVVYNQFAGPVAVQAKAKSIIVLKEQMIESWYTLTEAQGAPYNNFIVTDDCTPAMVLAKGKECLKSEYQQNWDIAGIRVFDKRLIINETDSTVTFNEGPGVSFINNDGQLVLAFTKVPNEVAKAIWEKVEDVSWNDIEEIQTGSKVTAKNEDNIGTYAMTFVSSPMAVSSFVDLYNFPDFVNGIACNAVNCKEEVYGYIFPTTLSPQLNHADSINHCATKGPDWVVADAFTAFMVMNAMFKNPTIFSNDMETLNEELGGTWKKVRTGGSTPTMTLSYATRTADSILCAEQGGNFCSGMMGSESISFNSTLYRPICVQK